jgi:Uma2 family endonuclease
MATAAAHAYVPVEVYLTSEYEPDAEYVDGVIEERPMGQYDHSSWQQAIQLWFQQHASQWGVRQRPELRVQVAGTRYRVPDVTILSRDQPIEQIITHAPLAVFEVLSPEDRLPRMMRKLGEYEAMGIRQIWLVDPETGEFFRFHNGGLEVATHFGEEGDTIHFALNQIKAFLD